VNGVSGKPWASTASGNDASSIAPKVNGCGEVTPRAYYSPALKRKGSIIYI
jgi:hypothetical protein